MDVPEVGRQQRQARRPSWPARRRRAGCDREAVAQIVDRGRHDAERGREPGQADQPVEGVVDVAVEQPGPAVDTSSAGVPVWGRAGHAAAGSAQRATVVWVQRQLRGSCRTCRRGPAASPAVEVDVAAVERDRLTDPHPGHRQQPDQGGERGPPQRRAQRAGGVRSARRSRRRSRGRGGAVAPARQQLRAAAPRARVEGVQVGGEPAHRRQPVGPPVEPSSSPRAASPRPARARR